MAPYCERIDASIDGEPTSGPAMERSGHELADEIQAPLRDQD